MALRPLDAGLFYFSQIQELDLRSSSEFVNIKEI